MRKCITFDKAAQDALPEEIKRKMKKDKENARKEEMNAEQTAKAFERAGMLFGTNEHGYRKTELDGKKARVLNKHPHNGATAVCVGCDRTLVGWGMVFKRLDTGETFFVFKPRDIEWI
jgi:hypothetical protein